MPLPLYPIPLVQVQADSSQLPNPSCTPVPVNSLTSTDLVGSKAASLEVDLASVRQRNAELVVKGLVKGQEDAVSGAGEGGDGETGLAGSLGSLGEVRDRRGRPGCLNTCFLPPSCLLSPYTASLPLASLLMPIAYCRLTL